jgi:hypothetical protein
LENRVRQRSARTKAHLTAATVTWRKYYAVRNLVLILRDQHAWWAATRVSIRSGVAGPLSQIARRKPLAFRQLGLGIRGAVDGWRGRTGRTVEPGGE